MAEVTGHGRQKRSSGDSRNSIMNYFSKSQNKSQNANDQYFPSKDVIGINELSVIYDEVDEVEVLHAEENEDIIEEYNVVVGENNVVHKCQDKSSDGGVDDDDQSLIEELLPDQDSGVSSLSSSPPSIQKLCDNPPSEDMVKMFDLSEAISRVMIKLGLSEPRICDKVEPAHAQSVTVFPALVNESDEDMFKDFDSDFDNIDFSTMEQGKVEDLPKRQVNEEPELDVPESNFDLGSPTLDENDEKNDVNEEMNVPESNFDLGSPTLDEDDQKDDSIIMKNECASKEICDPETFDPEAGSKTSTPIVSRNVKPKQDSLRMATLKKALKTNADEECGNISDDMFNDSDDELFENIDLGEQSLEKKSKSLFSATTLIEMMNETSKSNTTKVASAIPKKKLSSIFNAEEQCSKSKPVESSVDIFAGESTFDFGSQDFIIEEAKENKSPQQAKHSDNNSKDENNDSTRQERTSIGDNSENSVVQRDEHACVICSKIIKGDLQMYNEHLDQCLSEGIIKKMTQADHSSDTSSRTEAVSPPTSPIVPRSRPSKRALVIASQSVMEKSNISNTSRESRFEKPRNKLKKKTGGGRMFLDDEADMSGDDHSEDEAEESQDHYDESFVDNATQDVDHGVYLRSVKTTPEFRKPSARALRPITDDIFSQQVRHDTSDDQYQEDSFCMADSVVEDDTHQDTLDILERKAEEIRFGGRRFTADNNEQRKRKRIIIHSSDDESITETGRNVEPEKEKKRKRIQTIVSSDEDESSVRVISDKTSDQPNMSETRTNITINTSYMSDSVLEAEKMLVIMNNAEVNRLNELISCLRHLLGLKVIVSEKCRLVTFVTGRNSAVILLSEQSFNNGALKNDLVKRCLEAKECYPDLTVILESDKVKPGDRVVTKTRTKLQDLLLGQILASGVRILYSSSHADSATIVSRFVEKADRNGEGLPRQKFTLWQEKMVNWLVDLPGVGLGAAYQMAVQFTSLRELISSSRDTLVSKGISVKLAQLLSNKVFNTNFKSDLAHIAPL